MHGFRNLTRGSPFLPEDLKRPGLFSEAGSDILLTSPTAFVLPG